MLAGQNLSVSFLWKTPLYLTMKAEQQYRTHFRTLPSCLILIALPWMFGLAAFNAQKSTKRDEASVKFWLQVLANYLIALRPTV